MGITIKSLACSLGCIAGLAASSAASQDMADWPPADIRIEGDAIYYSGPIGDGDDTAFLNAVKSAEGLRRLVINSGGGRTDIARRIARLVAAKGLDVEVVEVCFSSCANYIFVAGKNKRIASGAIVGWHGGETQEEILALSELGRTVLEDDFDSAEVIECECFGELDPWQDVDVFDLDEAFFFEEMGVDIELTVHGFRPQYIAAYKAGSKAGWTYSIADMERFGLTGVSYLGGGRYEDSEAVKAEVMVFPYD